MTVEQSPCPWKMLPRNGCASPATIEKCDASGSPPTSSRCNSPARYTNADLQKGLIRTKRNATLTHRTNRYPIGESKTFRSFPFPLLPMYRNVQGTHFVPLRQPNRSGKTTPASHILHHEVRTGQGFRNSLPQSQWKLPLTEHFQWHRLCHFTGEHIAFPGDPP
jgi:hypothetical protein